MELNGDLTVSTGVKQVNLFWFFWLVCHRVLGILPGSNAVKTPRINSSRHQFIVDECKPLRT